MKFKDVIRKAASTTMRVIGMVVALALVVAAIMAYQYLGLIWATVFMIGAIAIGVASLIKHKQNK